MPWPLDNPRWTPERLDELRVLVADHAKYSAAQIGDLLHVKRNAVIGACYRNGIKLQGKPSGTKRVQKGQKRKRVDLTKLFPQEPKQFRQKAKRSAEMRLADVVPLNLELADLAVGECRYPTGDGPFLFCGHPIREESSYCSGHHALTHKKPHELSEEGRAKIRHIGFMNVRNGSWRNGAPRKRTAA